jgi:glycolate oxidase FAD binding subunit
MKNVAGYDVSRVLAGSLGCLGVITHASLKVLPRPFAEESRVLMLSEADALRTVSQWCGRALPVSAASWHMGRLIVRFSGAEAAVREAVRHSGGEELQDAGSWWRCCAIRATPIFRKTAAIFCGAYHRQPPHRRWR